MITYKTSPTLQDSELSALFKSAWGIHSPKPRAEQLVISSIWVCAYDRSRLVGFVKVLWDGGDHGFVLDTTTHPDYQRKGIATELLRRIAAQSKALGITWLHVDFESRLAGFYRKAGYEDTHAGLMKI